MMETLVIRTTTIKFRLTRMELDCDKFECLQREYRVTIGKEFRIPEPSKFSRERSCIRMYIDNSFSRGKFRNRAVCSPNFAPRAKKRGGGREGRVERKTILAFVISSKGRLITGGAEILDISCSKFRNARLRKYGCPYDDW